MTYEDYVFEFGKDETTSPRGIENREFVRECVQDDEQVWQLCTWGVGGNNFSVIQTFGTKEEAEESLFKTYEYNLQENWNAPSYHSTPEEAIASAFEVDLDVAESILLKMQKVKIAKENRDKIAAQKREQEKKEKDMADYNARIAAGLPADKIEATLSQFPLLIEKFRNYIEQKNIQITNRSANQIAWKKQDWFIGGADVVTLRSLIKNAFR